MSTRPAAVTALLLAVASATAIACSSAPETPARRTPFEIVESPRDLCGTALETELRQRHIDLPTCGRGVEMVFVRARAAAHDVVVIAYDDVTPTYDDAPPDHGACVVLDGAPHGAGCGAREDDFEERPEAESTLGDLLGAAPPPGEAEARAILRAAILARAGTTHIAWDDAGREATSASWGPMRDMLAAIPVGLHTGPSGMGARAFAATRDHFYFGWRADIERYDAWLTSDGRLHERAEPLFQVSGDHHRTPPWEMPERAE